MGGGNEWQTRSKQRTRPVVSLADWCDTNLPTTKGARIAGLVANREATVRVVGILKAYQKRGAVLGSAQRSDLEAELLRAGHWETASAAPAPAGQRRAAPRATPAPAASRNPRQLRRARRGADAVEVKKNGAAEVETSHADIEVEPAVTSWLCADCNTSHETDAKQCRVCKWKRVPAPKVASAQDVSSEEDNAIMVAKLLLGMDSLKAIVHMPGIKASIASLQAKIDSLSKPAAPAPGPDQATQLRVAQLAVDSALARVTTVTEISEATLQRISRLQTDLGALGQSLANAQQVHQDAVAAYAAVRLAIGAQAPAPGAATAHAAQVAAPYSTFRANADVVFARHQATLAAPGAEEQVKLDMEKCMLEWGCASQADFSMVKYMARIADALRAELIGVPAWQPTATVAASPGAAKVHATRPTMTAGPTVTLAAQAVPSGAQITKEGVAKARQDEHRQLTLEAKREVVLERHQVELQQVEAEHAGDLSDNGSSA